MAIAIVQTALSAILNQSNVAVTFSPAPVEGNLMVVVIVYDARRALVLPPDETDGWTTRVAEAAVGSDANVVLRIDEATVGSGTDTSWFWDINPNGILGVMCIEISGADIGGTLKTESDIDSTDPMSVSVDGDTDPSGEMFYVVGAGEKEFGARIVTLSNSDASMTLEGADSSDSGTNWAMAYWSEILNAARPTATITSDDPDAHTGTGILLGIPVSAEAAAVYPPFPRRQNVSVRL